MPPFFIFRLTQSGGYSKLLTFPSAYGGAAVSLIAATDGNLYGTFSAYGTSGTGVIYRRPCRGGCRPWRAFPQRAPMKACWTQLAGGGFRLCALRFHSPPRHLPL